MFSLEPEIEALRPRLGDAAADALIARERREVFSVYPELRIAGWLGATLLAAAAGVLLKNNLDRIGPLALAIGIGIAAAACYAWTWLRRNRASVVDDYVLLLGALLVSADVAFIEAQFDLFGDAWRRHLLLLAIVHGAGAYVFRSRILLSLAITSLGAWLGFERDMNFDDVAIPAYELAALLIAWRAVDRAARPHTTFSRTLEHFAASAALIGSVALMEDLRNTTIGSLVTIAVAALVIAWGFYTRHEPFVFYAFIFGVIGVLALIFEYVQGDGTAMSAAILGALIAAVSGLLFLHARFKELK